MSQTFFGRAGKKVKAPKPLLNWKVVHERMPWNIILLLGGGFALAKGSEVNTFEIIMLTFMSIGLTLNLCLPSLEEKKKKEHPSIHSILTITS